MDFPADMDVLEFAKHWYDAVHGTSSGLLNFHTAVKGALRAVPFGDLKYAMFKAEYTFMIAKANARLGRDVDRGWFRLFHFTDGSGMLCSFALSPCYALSPSFSFPFYGWFRLFHFTDD